MIISSVIKRYLNTYDSPLNVVMSQCDNRKFYDFLMKTLSQGSNIISLEDTLFGNVIPDIIICNNKINHLEKCGNLSYFFHCPILIIDHDTKPGFLDKDLIQYQSNSIYSIALTDTIKHSWGDIHNLVLGFDEKQPKNMEQWKNLLYQVSKIPFSLKPKNIDYVAQK